MPGSYNLLTIARAKSGLERTNRCTSTTQKPSALAIWHSPLTNFEDW